MCATAAGFSASAARPYTVSVGSPITAPARKAATALASSVVWADVGMAVRDRTAGFSKCPSILQRNQQPQQQVDQNSGKRRRQDRYDDVDHAQAIDADIETAGEAADDAGDHAVAARAAKRCGVAHGDPQCAENSWTESTSTRTCSGRSEEHTSELQSLMRISYAVFCLK